MRTLHCDVAVVGGGPVGALVALGFARAGHHVTLVEARSRDALPNDARALALSWASREALAEVGAWPDWLEATAIDTVHVSQQDAWGRTVLSRADLDLPHLGVVVDYPQLVRAAGERLEAAGVRVCWGARVHEVRSLDRYARLSASGADGELELTCRLAVLADGGPLVDGLPGVRRLVHDYRQSALLAEVRCDAPHGGTAYERFSRSGPLALLPHGDAYRLVWTRSSADAERLLTAPEAEVVAELQQALGERCGRVLSVGDRAAFPLALRQASRVWSGRVALVGNAAQTMHPVAAQGLNLGVRDALGLIDAAAGCTDPGDARLLGVYASGRRVDSHAVVGFTHGLIRLFDGHGPLTALARGLGMNALDALPPLRRRFASHLVFGVGGGR